MILNFIAEIVTAAALSINLYESHANCFVLTPSAIKARRAKSSAIVKVSTVRIAFSTQSKKCIQVNQLNSRFTGGDKTNPSSPDLAARPPAPASMLLSPSFKSSVSAMSASQIMHNAKMRRFIEKCSEDDSDIEVSVEARQKADGVGAVCADIYSRHCRRGAAGAGLACRDSRVPYLKLGQPAKPLCRLSFARVWFAFPAL